MDFDTFKRALDDGAELPAGLPCALRALWHDARGDDERALRAARSDSGAGCLRVRAYLARKAGDARAARLAYWRAGTPPWSGTLESEWRDIAHTVFTELHVAHAYL